MAKKAFTVRNRALFRAFFNLAGGMTTAVDELRKLQKKPFGDSEKDKVAQVQLRNDAKAGYMAKYCRDNGYLYKVAPPRGVNDVAGFWERYAIDQLTMAGNKRSDLGHYAEKAAREKWSKVLKEADLAPVDTRGGKRANTGRKRKEEEKAPKAVKPEPRIVNVSEEAIEHIPTWQNVATAKDWLAGQFALIEKAAARNPDVANDKAIADVFAKIHKLLGSL